MLSGILFPMYQQACYIVQPRSAYRVSLSGFGHVSRAFLLPFECTTISVRPPFGGVANALGNSDIAHSCSWNSAVFILYCPIVFRLQSMLCCLELLSVIGACALSCLSFPRSKYHTIDNNHGSCWDYLLFVVFVTVAKQSVKVLFVILLVSLGSFGNIIMPPRKRAPTQRPPPAAMPGVRPNKRARRGRLRPDDVPIVNPTIEQNREVPRQASEAQGTVSVDVGAITSTISAVLSQAIKSAFAPENLASIIGGNAQQKQQDVTQDASGLVDQAVDDDVIAITMNTAQSGTEGALVSADPNDPRPHNLFTSVSVPLASRVSSKIKAKIWANEFISFGTLLSDSPQEVGKYSLSMAPSVGASTQPQLTLEPCHTSKRITNISQWVSAFTIFVSVYSEKVVNQAAQLMKYCEVVRDLTLKGSDWHWYDEQFRYLRQSSPEQYPWDQIHWELWLRASNPFRKSQTQLPANKRFRSQWFPKGTCWALHAGKHCGGCQFEHLCFRCGGKHPGG